MFPATLDNPVERDRLAERMRLERMDAMMDVHVQSCLLVRIAGQIDMMLLRGEDVADRMAIARRAAAKCARALGLQVQE